MNLTSVQLDRAAGTLLGLASGDALGAGYDCLEPMADAAFVTMKGEGNLGRTPGEWSADTELAIDVVGAAAAGRDLRNEAVQRDIVSPFGAVTHKHSEERAGRIDNSSVLRSAAVALAYLDDPVALAEAARAVSTLTHDPTDAQDACVLWALAVRHAVLHGELNVRVGLTALPRERQSLWWRRLDDADRLPLSAFDRNGGVVQALQGAWSALAHLDVVPEIGHTEADFLRQSIENAVRGGRGSSHVAAITGALAGARWGASAVPAEWTRILHGRPGLRSPDLVRLGVLAASKGAPDVHGWPSAERVDYKTHGESAALVRHPHDSGVWLGGVEALDQLPAEVDAVVSLCRVGTAQVPARIRDQIAVWLVDDPRPEMNPNLDFLLVDTVDEIAALRAEGHIVFVHCVQAASRTPAVAALYASRHCGIPLDQALADITRVLPSANPIPALRDALAPSLMRVEH